MTTALDTLQVAKDLQAASFTEAQAEALARVLRDRQEADLSQLATKADLKAEIANLKADLLKWIITMLLGQVAVIAALVKLL